jgi:hypothetical protein
MRHAASVIAALEGISRPAFRIARELANNSRSGLTSRFLSKKLDIPEEEVEYLVDVNHRLLFTDLTKIKIAAEGINAVNRISNGLENHGDVPSLFRHVKALSPHEFRQLEELVGFEGPLSKRLVAEDLVERWYIHPDSVVTYVATRGFSPAARELFDVVWQSKDGVMSVSAIRAAQGGSEYEVEQGLWELFRGLALFEMFRFDAEDRLVRAVGLLSELRQWRDASAHQTGRKTALKPHRGAPQDLESHGIGFSDQICRLVAAVAAKPVRLRGDGDLFREDRRRLDEVTPEEVEPSLSTCLWASQGVGWLARVDNELRAGDLDLLLKLDPISRHRLLCDWLLSTEKETYSRHLLTRLLEELKIGTWYPAVEGVRYAMALRSEDEQAVLRCSGGHWHYVSPSASAHSERALMRSIEETLLWLGLVDHGEDRGESLFRLTELGHFLLTSKGTDAPVPATLASKFPRGKAEIIVQPNFDVVVPTHDMDPLLTVPLDKFAERVSTGKATVYRLSKESFTRALQDGDDGHAFVEFLMAHNRGGSLPANVMTTLEDWRGGVKRVRLRTLQILETDDPLVLADLLHRRRLKKFLAPVDSSLVATYSKISRTDLLKEIEKDGFVVD